MAGYTMALSILLLALAVVSSADLLNTVLKFQPLDSGVEQFQITDDDEAPKPSFCKDLDCPRYRVIKKNATWELREYEAILWAQSNSKNIDFSNAQQQNFMRLFKYIQGANVKKQKIPMTVPVLNRIIPGQGPACESDFTMSFFLTQQRSAFSKFPKPTGKVNLQPTKKFRVYVRSFSGYVVSYERWRKQAMQLIADLNDQTKYDTTKWFIVGYDSPFTLFNRHNEVWLVAK